MVEKKFKWKHNLCWLKINLNSINISFLTEVKFLKIFSLLRKTLNTDGCTKGWYKWRGKKERESEKDISKERKRERECERNRLLKDKKKFEKGKCCNLYKE